MTKTITYECKRCGNTFEGDLWYPDYPDVECLEHEGGQHIYAEKVDDNV